MKPYSQQFICDTETPITLLSRLALNSPYHFLFESGHHDGSAAARYSIIGFEAMENYTFEAGTEENPFEVLEKAFLELNYEADPLLPRFQAGLFGYFTYEAVRHIEKVPTHHGELTIPEAIFFIPKKIVVIDHHTHHITFIAYSPADLEALVSEYKKRGGQAELKCATAGADVQRLSGEAAFMKDVERAQENIRAGEVFQVVISEEFSAETPASGFELYRKLRSVSPSPYLYYLHFPTYSVIGASPETLVRTDHDAVIVRPLAGTRRRGKDAQEDARLAEELRTNEKERAEHMMLVDLGRNDLGRISEPGTICATRLMEIDLFSHVMHMVSELRGMRKKDATLFDIFKATFPAGTLTGAPKIRAMELIYSLEKKPRGLYGGAVGYFGFTGEMDFAIAIRTMVLQAGRVTLRAGAGIVYDSIPAHEYLESCNKARGPLAALS